MSLTVDYEAKVVPILDYACCVWGYKTYKDIEKVHFRAMRAFLGVGKFSALPSIEGDMGWAPVYIRQHASMLSLWFHLCSLPNERIVKKIFLWDYDLSVKGKDNWCKSVKTILSSHNLVEIYQDINVSADLAPGRVSLIKEIEKTMLENYVLDWQTKIRNMPKLRTYITIKDKFGIEDYVRLPMTRDERSVIARLRNGTFPLQIELGRYRNIPIEQRLCPKCREDVESERHFLFECKEYTTLRQHYLELSDPMAGDGLRRVLGDGGLVRGTIKFVKSAYRQRNA